MDMCVYLYYRYYTNSLEYFLSYSLLVYMYFN